MADEKKQINMPNLRQLIGFVVFMQGEGGVRWQHPDYVFEKFIECCRGTFVPESRMDDSNMAIMAEYARRFELDWNPSRDYNDVPHGFFNARGEPVAFINRPPVKLSTSRDEDKTTNGGAA